MRLNKTLSNRFLNKLDSLIKMFKTKLKYVIINPYHIKKARNTFVLVFLAFKMIILLFPLDCTWWLRGNVIDNAINVVHLIDNST